MANPGLRIIALSATVPNIDDVASWLSGIPLHVEYIIIARNLVTHICDSEAPSIRRGISSSQIISSCLWISRH